MCTNLDKSKLHLALNGEFVPRKFAMEFINTVETSEKKIVAGTGQDFTLTYKGINDEGLFKYSLKVTRRFFINARYNIVTKLNKAQKIALQVARINDALEIVISKDFKLVRIANFSEIQKKWASLKPTLLKTYPDLQTVVSDFDWQLQDENIQNMFLRDNFYAFFFSGIYYHDFEETPVLKTDQIITDALPGIDIPINLEQTISKNDYLFTNATVESKAILNTDHSKYNPTRLAQFLNKLAIEDNDAAALQFNYDGKYLTKPRVGLVIGGDLEYSFEFPKVYKKTTSISFNLEKDE